MLKRVGLPQKESEGNGIPGIKTKLLLFSAKK